MFHRGAGRRPVGGRRGYIAVIAALLMIPLMGILALGIDGGMLMAERRKVQAAADAATQGASTVVAKAICAGTTPDYTEAKNVALAVAAKNGYSNDGTSSVVSYSATQGSAGSVSVSITSYSPRFFSAIWGGGSIPVVASSKAQWPAQVLTSTVPASSASIICLDRSASGSLTIVGSAQLVTNAVVQVDSTSTSAFTINNSGKGTASTFNICGKYSQDGSWSPIKGTINTGAKYVADPLATLAAPSTVGLTVYSTSPMKGSGSQTINPGVYVGGLSIGGGQSVTMNSGIYYMKGGSFSIANGASLSGSGVMIYVDSSGGGISFQGGARITLSAPTTGTYTGVVMYIDRASTKGTINIANGTDTTSLTGTVYAASCPVTFAGGATYNQMGSQYICDTMNLSNNAYVGITWSSSAVASQPPRPAVPAIVQ